MLRSPVRSDRHDPSRDQVRKPINSSDFTLEKLRGSLGRILEAFPGACIDTG